MAAALARARDVTLVALASVATLIGFAACFYLAFEVLKLEGGVATGVAAGAGCAWIALVLGLIVGVQRRRDATAARARAAVAAREAAARQAEVEALASLPQWAHWAGLIRRWSLTDAARLADLEARYRAVLADPKRNHHAPMLLQGRFHTDLQMDYLDDPRMLCCCPHLQPLEAALRRAGIGCLPVAPLRVNTEASLDPEEVRAQFALPAQVRWYQEEPHPQAAPDEYFHCESCRSALVSGYAARFP